MTPSEDLQEVGCRCFERYNEETGFAEGLAILMVDAPPSSTVAAAMHLSTYKEGNSWDLLEKVGSYKIFDRG